MQITDSPIVDSIGQNYDGQCDSGAIVLRSLLFLTKICFQMWSSILLEKKCEIFLKKGHLPPKR